MKSGKLNNVKKAAAAVAIAALLSVAATTARATVTFGDASVGVTANGAFSPDLKGEFVVTLPSKGDLGSGMDVLRSRANVQRDITSEPSGINGNLAATADAAFRYRSSSSASSFAVPNVVAIPEPNYGIMTGASLLALLPFVGMGLFRSRRVLPLA